MNRSRQAVDEFLDVNRIRPNLAARLSWTFGVRHVELEMVGLFAIADRTEAKRLMHSLARGESSVGAELRGMALIDLATLTQLILPGFDGIRLVVSADRVLHGAAVAIPSVLTERIVALTDDELEPLSDRWAESEEFRGLIPADLVKRFLCDLKQIAIEAMKLEKPLLFVNL